MCGIAGYFRKGLHAADAVQEVAAMSRKIAHRGPDGEGIIAITQTDVHPLYTSDTPTDHRLETWRYSPGEEVSTNRSEVTFAALAHRRLSVLDLSARGHQPMSDQDGRYWITFNGEIYNYRALRTELRERGITFNSDTDTEVVLSAYKVFGEEMVLRLEGMFAFAIYDRYTKKLFCARDQTGVKPFLFVDHARYFSFASEEKAFFGIRHFSSSVRAEAVFDFFVSGKFGHEPEGFFEGIKELGAGHILIYDAEKGVVNIREYRDVSMPVPEPVLNTEESFRKLFFDAVEQHLQADVRVGACLSGGLDSSSIVAAISQIRGGRDQTPLFTASFPGEPFDETPFASEVAQKFGGDHHLIFPGPEGLAYELDDLIYSQDIPLWSTSTYAQHSVMRGVGEAGIKVVLDGQGGDELLGGYHHHYYAYWRSLFLSGRLNRFFKEFRGTGSYLPAPSYLMRALLQREVLTKVPSGLLGIMMRSYHRDMRWLKPSFLSVFKERMQASEQFSDLPSMLDQDFFGWRLKGYLKCEDRAAMWHSVESRTPFADSPSLIKFCRSLDSDWKIRKGASKYILRHSMQGLVPSKVLDRRDKIGYATPNKAWIKAILPRAMEEIRYGGAEFFDFRQIERDFKESLTGENPHDTRIFKFISFGVWRRIFSV